MHAGWASRNCLELIVTSTTQISLSVCKLKFCAVNKYSGSASHAAMTDSKLAVVMIMISGVHTADTKYS